MKIKSFESMRNYKKKVMLGTSDAWSMSHLSQQPTKPVYYIEDCWISKYKYDVQSFYVRSFHCNLSSIISLA